MDNAPGHAWWKEPRRVHARIDTRTRTHTGLQTILVSGLSFSRIITVKLEGNQHIIDYQFMDHVKALTG